MHTYQHHCSLSVLGIYDMPGVMLSWQCWDSESCWSRSPGESCITSLMIPPGPLLSVPKFMSPIWPSPWTSIWYSQLPWTPRRHLHWAISWTSKLNPNLNLSLFLQTIFLSSVSPKSILQLLMPKSYSDSWLLLLRVHIQPVGPAFIIHLESGLFSQPHCSRLVNTTVFSSLAYGKNLTALPTSILSRLFVLHTAARESL